MIATLPPAPRCPCTRAGLPVDESQCALCTFDEVNGVQRSAAPTIPVAPADPVPALVALALELSVKGARFRRGEAALSPTDAARLRRMVAAEQDRLTTAGRRGDA